MTAGGGGGNTIFFLIFVLVGLKEACMSNFSFLGSFSGTSPGGRVLDISKLRLSQPSLAGSWAELGNDLGFKLYIGMDVILQSTNHHFPHGLLIKQGVVMST